MKQMKKTPLSMQDSRLEQDVQTVTDNLEDLHTRMCRMLDCSYIHTQALAQLFARACAYHSTQTSEDASTFSFLTHNADIDPTKLSAFYEHYPIEFPSVDELALPQHQAAVTHMYRQMSTAEQICFYRALISDPNMDCNALLSRLLPHEDPIEAFARGTIVYQHNIYADEAFLHFSRVLPTAKACYSDSFTGVCEQVFDGQCEYCILPLENTKDGKLVPFYDLMKKYELKIALTCSVTTSDSRHSTVFALCRRSLQIPFVKFLTQNKSTFFEFIFWQEGEQLTLSKILTAAECCSLTLVRADCLPRSDDEFLMGAGYPFNLCFEITPQHTTVEHLIEQNFVAFLIYLSVHSPTYLPLGIYQRL